MKICVLKESLKIGGTERSAANISRVLCKEHDVYTTLFDGRDAKYLYGGELVNFALPPKPSIVGKIINTYLRDIKIRRFLRQKKIDILYTFTAINNRQTRFKYNNTVKIISARDYGAMERQHNNYHDALLNSDAMICNSEYTKDFYLSKYPEHADRVYAVYNYIDVDEICAQANEPIEDGFNEFLSSHSNTVISVGRFCKEKGFEFLIEAIAQARKTDNSIGLVLVGDGDFRQKYLDIIEKHQLQEHVYFTGFQKNPYKYMSKCGCYVLSSISEGFPNVLAEAMALGLPVIATNCFSGPAEILRKDKNYTAVTDKFTECDFGIITPKITIKNNENAISQLSGAVTALLGNKNITEKYSALSQTRAKEFSEDAVKNQLNNIFNELIERK